MKKIFLSIIGITLLAACSVKSNEEKVRELIEPKIKANLIKPDSYEFGSLQLDSCFSDDSQYNPEAVALGIKVAKLFIDYKEYKSDAENAESSMSIYAPSYGYQSEHDKQQQKKYRAEMEKAQRKADAAKEQIIQIYKNNSKLFEQLASGKHEFIGWMAAFGYRAETAGGLKTMGVALYYLNKDLTEITHQFSEDDMRLVQEAGLEDLQYEFEDELSKLAED